MKKLCIIIPYIMVKKVIFAHRWNKLEETPSMQNP